MGPNPQKNDLPVQQTRAPTGASNYTCFESVNGWASVPTKLAWIRTRTSSPTGSNVAHMSRKSHFSRGKRRWNSLEENCRGSKEEPKQSMMTTTGPGMVIGAPGSREEILDQLKAMLERERKYGREDYIGCFLEDNRISVVPPESSQPQRMLCVDQADSCHSRKSKQSKTSQNACVNTPIRAATTSSTTRKPLLFSEYHRARLCEWAIEVVNYYSFPLHSVEVTMNILDRYLGLHVPPEERSMGTLHLLTLTSLYLALKLTTSQRPPPQVFVRLSRSKFTARQVEETELKLMQGLGWHLNPPTAEDFALSYLQVLAPFYPLDILRRMEASALESIRTTVSDYVWVRYSPSVVAMGALSWSLFQVDLSMDRYPNPLEELHRCGIYVHQLESMQTLEYFYLRAMYTSPEVDRQDMEKLLTRTRSASLAQTRHASPVSIMKDPIAVIDDED